MKNTKISRRSFLLGLAACSAAGVLTACSGSSEPASSASTAPEPPASSAASEVTAAPFLTVEDFPALDGSTACIPLMAQMLADTTGMDLEEAQSIISVSTTAYAWESFGLYNTDTKMLVVYEAPDSVKEELEAANVQLEQKPIGVDALVFIVNEDNPVTDLTQRQLRDIYAGKITNWKDVGGQDLDIVAFQRRSDSGSQTLFQKLLIQGGPLMHVIAAKAVCFEEALSDDFKVYQKNIVDNAQALCKGLMSRDIKIVSGGTDNHLMLVDLTPYGLTGKAVEKLLDAAHITANKNTIPNDPQSPFVTSGIRLGTPAVTSRGLNTEDMDQVAEAIAMVIKGGEEQVPAARAIIQKLTDKYPLI